MEEKTKMGKQSMVKQSAIDNRALDKKLNAGIFGNRLFIRSVNVGSNLGNMFCDIIINGRGRFTLITDKMRFNADLKSIDPSVLRDAVKYLDKYGNKGFRSAIQKMKAILARSGPSLET